MKKETKVILVPHTHWDAEWYFTTHDTNTLLFNNVKDASMKLEKGSYPFTWDGQSFPVQKYLSIEDDKTLLKQIADKKMLVGPWYTQATARQILGENYFRNLEHGISVAEGLGHAHKHGMMSDIFGFADQVPQVLAKNNVHDIYFMRGWKPETTNYINEFNWVSPSGDEVFAKSLHQGYGNAKFLSGNLEEVKTKFVPIKNGDLERTVSGVSLLFHGGDQMYMRDQMDEVVSKINEFDNSDWQVGSLEDYIREVKESLKDKKLSKYKGEIIEPIGQRIHLSAYSQRQDINELIADLEYKLVYRIEPLNVMIMKNNLFDYSSIIYKAWEALFLSTAHDAAAGCNSDETNAQIKQRLLDAHQSIDSLENLIKRLLVQSDEVSDMQILVANTNTKNSDLTISAEVVSKTPSFNLTMDDRQVSFVVSSSERLSEGKRIEVTKDGEVEIELGQYYLHKVKIFIPSVKALSFKKINVIESEVDSSSKNITFELDKKISLLYEANDGDSYDFSPSKDAYSFIEAIDTSKINWFGKDEILVANHSFTNEVWDDFLLRENKITQEYNLQMVKWPNGRIDSNLSLNNKMKNVRVSLLIDSKEDIETSFAKTMFFEKEYTNKVIPEDWAKRLREYPTNTFPFVGYIKAGDINLASKSLREYSYSKNQLSVTLFRSNGLLGKDNLTWRPGRASGVNDIIIQTPDAQVQMELSMDWSFINEGVENQTINYLTKVPTYQKQNSAKHIERLQRFFLPKMNATLNDVDLQFDEEIEVCALYSNKGEIKTRLLNASNQEKTIKVKINNITKEIKFKSWEIQTLTI